MNQVWNSIETAFQTCQNRPREKGRDLTQSYDKSPSPTEKIQKATWQHKNAKKIVDYTTIVDQLRTVSWTKNNHPISVVKPVYERSH